MSFNFAHVWTSMAPLSKGVALVLLTMAVAFIGVTIERLLTFARSTKESRAFAAHAGRLLEERRVEEIVALADKHRASTLARLFGPITRRYIIAFDDGEGGLSPIELARSRCLAGLEGIARRSCGAA